jgi:hypothetical protein
MGTRTPAKSRQHLLHLVTATLPRVPHILMGTIIFSTFALVGCAFLIYAWFRWLREELDLKRPAHRDRRKPLPPPYVNRKPHYGYLQACRARKLHVEADDAHQRDRIALRDDAVA